MNKSELVALLSEKTDLKRKEVEAVLNGFWETLSDTLVKGESVSFVEGHLALNSGAARQSRNPRTGEPVSIPATIVPHFSAGKVLKEKVKQAKVKTEK